ncbi:MAG: site-specific DNA-methyltransferase [Prevotella sp.]|nr:site-specific DNA-methyltransferase [Prevotella sp.]
MIDQVAHAEDQSLWHTLIEADNYYALQLLAYLYPGKVDCIYIDPPYNTGARDWKYNNDYVDSSDHYRHSKWLSMMKRRLALAKKLLNPKDSVLIVTIDEKEYLHLGCLLEEMFPEARMQMVSVVIKAGGVSRGSEFYRTNEFYYFISFGDAQPSAIALSKEWLGGVKNTTKNDIRWRELRRTSSGSLRRDRPHSFFPIFVHEDGRGIHSVGDPYYGDNYKTDIIPPKGTKAIWPLFPDGREGRWQVSKENILEMLGKGYIRMGKFTSTGMSMSYLSEGEQKKVEKGVYKIIGHRDDGSIITDNIDYVPTFIPGSIWQIAAHDATENGTKLLAKIIGPNRFSYPKSLYAVHDAIRFFVADKPDALIVDFFAGSGTTLHAVNLLNAADGGRRRCIMVTNNEVSDSEAKALRKQGLQPGDAEWERLGIARYVCWPRTVCSIEGHDVNSEPLRGEYLGTDHRAMKDGFDANCIFFRLAFLDKAQVALGRQFRELLPLLWMKAGAIGPCPTLAEGPDVPPMLILPGNAFAVLTDARRFSEFVSMVECEDAIRMVYLVVDSDSMYRDMSRHFPKRQTCQLYRDYLDNFRINQTR